MEEFCCNLWDTNFSETNETQILVPDNTRQVSDVCDLHELLSIWGNKWHNINKFSTWRDIFHKKTNTRH